MKDLPSVAFDDQVFEDRLSDLLDERAQQIDLTGTYVNETTKSRSEKPKRQASHYRYLAVSIGLLLLVASFGAISARNTPARTNTNQPASDNAPVTSTVPDTQPQETTTPDSTPDSKQTDDVDPDTPPPPDTSSPPSTNNDDRSRDIDLKTVRGITVNAEIADDLEALLAAAEDAGFILGGGGYRSPQAQIDLRRQNCGPTDYDIYEKPAHKCSPPTARPGRNLHEQGLAVDFTINGEGIKSRTQPSYLWLQNNAAKYGFINLPSEPWHWSVNGR